MILIQFLILLLHRLANGLSDSSCELFFALILNFIFC